MALETDCINYNRGMHNCFALRELFCETEEKPCKFKMTREEKTIQDAQRGDSYE